MHLPKSLIWSTPSHDSSGSMPLGNGDIGMTVCVEKDGDLLLYLGKTDAWDEHARLLKLGRIRVSLSPNPFASGAAFRQELDLNRGCICIQAESGDRPDRPHCDILVRVDASRPVARIACTSTTPIAVRVSVESWRTAERDRVGRERHCAAGLRSAQDRGRIRPDSSASTPPVARSWRSGSRLGA
jgi:alpha-L-fucosidase 2